MRRFLCLLSLVGCGDIIGLGGYTDQMDQMDGSSADVVSAPDGSSMDVRSDVPLGMDAPNCTPMSEDCTNGKDDDCNGLVDCADPACTMGFVCVPPLPNGWTWAVYDQDARPPCAQGFSMPSDVQEGITAAPATCGCSCSKTDPNCAQGNLTITAGGNMNCNNVTNQNNNPATAGCHMLSSVFSTFNQSISVKPPAPSGGSCTANPTKTVPMATTQHQGRTCTYTGTMGSGCMNQDVCMPKAAPFTACVAMAGMNACPMGFPVQHLVGSMLSDTRDCSACTCTFNAGTCGGTTTFYTDNACTFNAQAFAADGACHLAANRTWRSYKYAPTTNASCTASAVNAIGGVTFADLRTVCCTN